MSSTITLTFGNRAENNVGMQIIGEELSAGEGLTYDDLKAYKKFFDDLEFETEMFKLHHLLDDENRQNADKAYFLVIRKGCKAFVKPSNLYNELINLEWDSKEFKLKEEEIELKKKEI